MRNNELARQVFKKQFSGCGNFVTPEVEGYLHTEGMAIEVSKSDFIFQQVFGHHIWGVTVLEMREGEWVHDNDMSASFNSSSDAWDYAHELIEEKEEGRQ